MKIEMGITKTENYTDQQVQLARMLKVMGHPARIAILQSIIEANACVCGELVTEIGLAQSTISQHLKELKSVGLIKGTVEGTSVCYCIDMENWNLLKTSMEELLESPGKKPDSDCC